MASSVEVCICVSVFVSCLCLSLSLSFVTLSHTILVTQKNRKQLYVYSIRPHWVLVDPVNSLPRQAVTPPAPDSPGWASDCERQENAAPSHQLTRGMCRPSSYYFNCQTVLGSKKSRAKFTTVALLLSCPLLSCPCSHRADWVSTLTLFRHWHFSIPCLRTGRLFWPTLCHVKI